MGFLGNVGNLFKQFGGAVKENFLNNTAGAVWNGRTPDGKIEDNWGGKPHVPDYSDDLWEGNEGQKPWMQKPLGPVKPGIIPRLYHRNKVRRRERNLLDIAGRGIQEDMRFMGEFAQGGEIGDRQYGIVGEAGPEMVVNTGTKSQIIPIRTQMPGPAIARPSFRQSSRFKGLMAHGGTLRPGEFGIVGEEGPEIVSNEEGRTNVIPMPNPNVPRPGALDAPSEGLSINTEPQRRPLIPMPVTGTGSYEEQTNDDNKYDWTPPGLPYENPVKRNLRHSMSNLGRLNQIDTDDELSAEYDKKKDGMLKNIGKGIALGFSRLDPNVFLNKNIGDQTALGYAIGGALGGGIGGAVDPLQDERAQHARKLGIAEQGVARDQGMYKTDIDNRKSEMDIQNVESVIGDRAVDNARQMREMANKLEIAQGKLMTERYKDIRRGHTAALTFDPTKNAADRAASDEYQAITGVPLATKTAEVKDVEEFPNAANDRLFRRTTYKDGRVEAGYVKTDGTLTSNPNDGAVYKAPSVLSAEYQREASMHRTDTEAKVNIQRIEADIAKAEKAQDFDLSKTLAAIAAMVLDHPDNRAELEAIAAGLKARHEK